MTSSARTVVIGGGIMGVSVLYHLAKLGWTDSVLLERRDLTHGSTWHAAGLCTHFAHNATIMQMRADSIRQYSLELEQETGLSAGFRKTGALRITRSADRMDEFRHVQGIGQFVGHEFHIVTPDEVSELHPLANIDGLIGGIYEPGDGNVDPSQATQALASGARAQGALIYRNDPVVEIESTFSGEWRVITPNREILCEHVINAAGTWCREIGDMLGVDLPVVPVLHQYFVTESMHEVATLQRALPIIRDPEESWYIRQERDGLIFGPYERDAQPWSVDGIPDHFGADLLPPDFDRVETIVQSASARIPSFGLAGIRNVVNGPITFTPDANPLIGPAFGLRNAWLLTGSSMGVMEGGGAGRFLAQWIVGGEPPMDPIAVDSRRFGEYADRRYRVAKAKESFAHQFAVHYPREERPAGRPCLKSEFHAPLECTGAVFGAACGWERPNWFGSERNREHTNDSFRRTNWFDAVASECRTVAERVGICDMTALSKFSLTGGDAHGFLDTLGANRPPQSDGRVGLIHVLSRSGGVLSEFTVLRKSRNHYYLTSAAAALRHDFELLRSRARGLDVRVESQTSDYCVIGLMGPASAKLLDELTSDDLSVDGFPWLTGRMLEIRKRKLLAIRMSYAGESGWELHVHRSDALAIFSALTEAGRNFGIGYFGAFAIDAMRLEKGYRAWGMDLTTERTPLESGLGHLVRTENRQFIGRDAMLRRHQREDCWRMELLQIDSDGDIDPFYLHPLFADDKVIGIVTSAAFGHRTGLSLALAYLDGRCEPFGQSLEVEIIGHRFPAGILDRPPYDPDNDRLAADSTQ
ncbi:MAG: FAD-dependent oxidoreductase [Acidiferrobacterales bacterium]|nr:FAD-dependent oxidoreductase [Acidiferrobacterales bacterium]